MPLINCSDCDKEISDAAWSCVHCGKPRKEVSQLTGTGVFWAVFFALCLFAILPFLLLSSGILALF